LRRAAGRRAAGAGTRSWIRRAGANGRPGIRIFSCKKNYIKIRAEKETRITHFKVLEKSQEVVVSILAAPSWKKVSGSFLTRGDQFRYSLV
jgi:hypothetical protein